MPKISIICPSYNHEKYVGFFIKSVIKQTEKDWELIIIDDASDDKNLKEINKFAQIDKRIKVISHKFNQGINACINDATKIISSSIVCLIASDDKLVKNYLEEIINVFEKNKNVEVTYVALQHINENGKILTGQTLLPINLNKYEILEKSFFSENQLPSPGMAFRKNVLKEILPLPIGLFQYHDWQIHNLLLLNEKENLYLLNKPLIYYRLSKNSACSRSNASIKREQLETKYLMDVFLSIKEVDLLKKIFFKHQFLENKKIFTNEIKYFLGQLALKSNDERKQEWGYQVILEFISYKDNQKRLYNLYKFDFKTFILQVNLINKKLNKIDCELNTIYNSKFFKLWQKFNKLKRMIKLNK